MELAQNIITGCWIIFLGYWFIKARSVKQTEEKVGGIGGYWHWILMGVAFIITQDVTIYPLNVRLLPFSTVIGILSVVLAVGGLIIAIMARRTLAQNWSASVTFKKEHDLITSGVYKYMRHPIYTGVLLIFIGSALLIGTIGALIGFIILFVTLWLKLQQEEKLMTKHFPKEYNTYKKKVKALIPFIL